MSVGWGEGQNLCFLSQFLFPDIWSLYIWWFIENLYHSYKDRFLFQEAIHLNSICSTNIRSWRMVQDLIFLPSISGKCRIPITAWKNTNSLGKSKEGNDSTACVYMCPCKLIMTAKLEKKYLLLCVATCIINTEKLGTKVRSWLFLHFTSSVRKQMKLRYVASYKSFHYRQITF